MRPIIHFVKDIYLTAFTIIFRISRSKKTSYRAGAAICAVTVIESLFLVAVAGSIGVSLGQKLNFSRVVTVVAFIMLGLINQYLLFVRGYGTEFEREFDALEKSRRVALCVSCALAVIAMIVFFILSAITYRRFIGVH
jgi:hypothetical protein